MSVTDVEPNRSDCECPECGHEYRAVPSVAHADWDACPRCEEDEFQFNMERVVTAPTFNLAAALGAYVRAARLNRGARDEFFPLEELDAIEQATTQGLSHRKALLLVRALCHSHRALITYDLATTDCDGSGRIPKRSDA